MVVHIQLLMTGEAVMNHRTISWTGTLACAVDFEAVAAHKHQTSHKCQWGSGHYGNAPRLSKKVGAQLPMNILFWVYGLLIANH